jgi:STE24 endopeptidase
MAYSRIFGAALLLAMLSAPVAAQPDASALPQLPPHAAPTARIQTGTLPVMDTTPAFDPDKATAKYLSKVSGAARARSDEYFEGGYWLQLLDLFYALGVAGLLLWTGLSARIQDWAQARTNSRSYQVMLYVAAYVPFTVAATFPLSLYEGFFREHAYGLSNQTFWQWMGDFGIQSGLSFAAGIVFLPILYAAIRRARETWWIWGAGLAILFQVFVIVIWPQLIAPLFNHYSPLPDSPLKAKIMSLARANDVPVDNVWLVDASRQSNRISANVSGFLGTARISLNDNLLKQGTPDEVLAVLGHEMGHYVLGHVTRILLLLGLVILAGFAFVHWGFWLACEAFGGQWQVRSVSEVAGLPLLAAFGALFLFLATPATNSITRVVEYQADLFGLNAVRKPDAFASVMLKLSTYRKLEPSRWEEMIFYDHPSGRTRIAAAMRWKKEHITDTDIRDTAQQP